MSSAETLGHGYLTFKKPVNGTLTPLKKQEDKFAKWSVIVINTGILQLKNVFPIESSGLITSIIK